MYEENLTKLKQFAKNRGYNALFSDGDHYRYAVINGNIHASIPYVELNSFEKLREVRSFLDYININRDEVYVVDLDLGKMIDVDWKCELNYGEDL